MDIDLSILRMLEREKEIPFEVLAEAIETALLTAYQRATEAQHPARVELDRKTGHVTVWAREVDEDGIKADPAHREPGQRPTRRTERQVDAPPGAPNDRSAPHPAHRTPGQRPTRRTERQVSGRAGGRRRGRSSAGGGPRRAW